MSSHHFVTESQSTALYIVGKHIDRGILDQLLEWNPFIIANSNTLEWLNSMHVSIDVLVRTSNEGPEFVPYKTMHWPEVDLWRRIDDLFQNGKANRLAVIGAADENIGKYWSVMPAPGEHPITIYSGTAKYFPVPKGNVFKKWVNEGYQFQIDKTADAIVKGDVIQIEDLFQMKSSGWLAVDGLSDVIFKEYQ